MRCLIQLLILTILMSAGIDGNCQINRMQIKRNNKRMSTYRGDRFPFQWRYKTIGISFDALNYYGDLAPSPSKLSTNFALTKPGIGFFFSQHKGPRFSIQASFIYGAIYGADMQSAKKSDPDNGVYRYDRNLSFRNRIEELTFMASYDLFENHGTHMHRLSWTPYGFTGIAGFHHNPQAKIPSTDLNGNPFFNAGKWVDLQPLGTEGQYSNLKPGDANYEIKPYSLYQFAIPIGLGLRFRVKDAFDVSAEFSFRYTFTDYLDDVSRNYVDLGAFGNNELAKALSYRSNEVVVPNHTYTSVYDNKIYNVLNGYGSESASNIRGSRKDKDVYTVFSIKVGYLIAPKFHRPKIR